MLYICAKNSDKTIRSTSIEDRLVVGGKDRKEAPVIGVLVHQAAALTADRAEIFTASPAFVNRRGAYRFYLPPRAQYYGCQGSLQGWLDSTLAKMCTPAHGSGFIVARIYNIRASARAGNQSGTMAG